MYLGDLIQRLEAAPDQSVVVRWGFGKPHSSRGDYSELAFDPAENVTVASMLAHAKASLGATFEGWKGGDFTMHEYSACWIEKHGDWDQNGISDYLVNYWLAAADAILAERLDVKALLEALPKSRSWPHMEGWLRNEITSFLDARLPPE